MDFFLDERGFYVPPEKHAILSPFLYFGTRQATVPEGPLATVHQVHSTGVVRVDGPGLAGDGDALISDKPGLMLGIKTADCFPLLMVDIHHGAVAAVHAGWRGTAGQIGPAAVRAMGEAFGTRPGDVSVAIGPGIGACCFEVGEEVAREFGAWGDGEDKERPATSLPAVRRPGGVGERWFIDLAEVNRRQLEAIGVPADRIFEAGLCTMCRGSEFFSYRRDRERAGRMISFVALPA